VWAVVFEARDYPGAPVLRHEITFDLLLDDEGYRIDYVFIFKKPVPATPG
jgi:hypothetical protein